MLTHCSISCSSSGRITRLVANGVFLFLFFYISFIFDLSTLVPFALLPLRVRMNEIVSFPVADCVSHPIKTHTVRITARHKIAGAGMYPSTFMGGPPPASHHHVSNHHHALPPDMNAAVGAPNSIGLPPNNMSPIGPLHRPPMVSPNYLLYISSIIYLFR